MEHIKRKLLSFVIIKKSGRTDLASDLFFSDFFILVIFPRINGKSTQYLLAFRVFPSFRYASLYKSTPYVLAYRGFSLIFCLRISLIFSLRISLNIFPSGVL